MIATIVTNALSALLTVIWLAKDNILNSDFTAFVTKSLIENNGTVPPVLSNFQIFFMCIILFALALDTAVTIIKTLMNNK